MDKVAVLLSAYNGESYICAQIESICTSLKTAGIVGRIFIRDDNSSDHTIELIKKMKKKGCPITLFQSKENLGFKMSFWNLLNRVDDYDYYFFSDQDDIWLEDKVSAFLKRFHEVEANDKCAVYSDLLMFGDVLGSDIKDSEYYRWNHADDGLDTWLLTNTITGAALAINSKLRNYLSRIPESLIQAEKYHDWFIAKIVGAVGKYSYIDFPLTKYRQHSSNQSMNWNHQLNYSTRVRDRTLGYLVRLILAQRLLNYLGLNSYPNLLWQKTIERYLNGNRFVRLSAAISISKHLVPVQRPLFYRKLNFILFSFLISKANILKFQKKKIVNQTFQNPD
ncbi:glycosyltransferase [Oenococcus oeni]|uniref:glycosyltransferase n=1 Tax=Oenococcus oeni TaxID=1247 RepID=UPI0008F7F369|nr:glycosyltransferase [Oenococcus oeni]OIM08173.1 hypothetical protein ATX52_07475 [Oenococcus oeni]